MSDIQHQQLQQEEDDNSNNPSEHFDNQQQVQSEDDKLKNKIDIELQQSNNMGDTEQKQNTLVSSSSTSQEASTQETKQTQIQQADQQNNNAHNTNSTNQKVMKSQQQQAVKNSQDQDQFYEDQGYGDLKQKSNNPFAIDDDEEFDEKEDEKQAQEISLTNREKVNNDFKNIIKSTPVLITTDPSNIMTHLQEFDDINIKFNEKLNDQQKIKAGQSDNNADQQQLKKGQEFKYNEKDLFIVKKEPKTSSGFWEFLLNRATRYILIDRSYFYVLSKLSKDHFKIRSATKLQNLFKIFNQKNNGKEMRLIFYNNQLNYNIFPKQKIFEVENKLQFLKIIKNELNKLSYDFQLL